MKKQNYNFLIISIILLAFSAGCSLLPVEDLGTEIPALIKASPTPAVTVEVIPTDIPVQPTEQPLVIPTTEVLSGTQTFYQPSADEWNLYLGHYQQAEINYQSVLTNNSSSREEMAQAYLGLGRIAMLSNDTNKAIQNFDYLLQEYPTTEAAGLSYFFLGEIYTTLNENDKAIRAYQHFLQSNPGEIDEAIWNKIGDLSAKEGLYQEAINSYQTGLYFTADINQLNQIKKKMAMAYAGLNENDLAIQYFFDAYQTSEDGYLKAEINLRLSWLYFAMNLPDKAYERLQVNVNEFPYAYDSYTSLVTLIDNNQVVNEYQRGLTDYYAGKYGVAIDAFNRYIQQTPLTTRNGDVHHFKALSHVVLEQYDLAILEWEQLIENFESSNYWTDSFDEIAYTQWAYQNNPKLGAETYLNFVETYYFMDEAPIFLYRAARMYERADELQLAADIWSRVATEYPAYELAFRSQQLAGVSLYRLKDFQSAQNTFDTLLQYAAEPEEYSTAHFWLAKTYQALEMSTEAAAAWEQAITQSPNSYYGIRAKEIADQIPSFEADNPILTPIDLVRERESAAIWMQSEFLLEANFEQLALSTLANDEIIRQAQTYWKLGYYSESFALLEEARQKYTDDPVKLFSLIDLMLNLGSYRSAAFASREIIDLAQADPDNLLTVPKYFNHIRYGTFYSDLVLQAAADYNLSPMLLFSQIRQESLFDSQVGSSAGAMGVMQIISQTGQHIADQLLDPADYVTEDLFLPAVNIEYGTYYLDLQRDYFDGNLYLALAAYNAGPGNTEIWFNMAEADIDLFLEIIRFGETRDYLMNITETFQIYQNLYQEPGQ